jgi:enoyl-CoA hydratase/carnithine racemase
MKRNYKTVKAESRNGIVVIHMDNPPVNQLSDHFMAEIEEAVARFFKDMEVKAIVLTGTEKNFIAGADLKEMYQIREREPLLNRVKHASDFFRQIELGPKPVVAAINGNALGGGLELAMACHYRVASRGVRLGQPEVLVGLIPGAGGTQRLPRLIGLAEALEMITSGCPVTAEKAMSMKLVDVLTGPEDLLPTAVSAAQSFICGELLLNNERTCCKKNKLPSIAELQQLTAGAKAKVSLEAGGSSKAQLKAVEALEKGLTSEMEADMERERQLFCDCALSDEGRSMMESFLTAGSGGTSASYRTV